MNVTEFKAFEKNTLRGFFALQLPSGLIIHNCTLHEKPGRRWISLPARQYQKADGEKGWSPLIEFSSKEIRDKFQTAALAAVDAYLRETRQ